MGLFFRKKRPEPTIEAPDKKQLRIQSLWARLTPEQQKQIQARQTQRLEIALNMARLNINLCADTVNPCGLFNPKHIGRSVRKQASQTLLSVVSEGSQLDTVKNLVLQLKADVNVSDENGNTPLIFAVTAGRTRIARFLLKNGARMTQNKRGLSPLLIALIQDMPAMIDLFHQNGIDLNQRIPKVEESPVLCATLMNKPKVLQKLLDLGASVHVTSKHGTSLPDIMKQNKTQITPQIQAIIAVAIGRQTKKIDNQMMAQPSPKTEHARE